MWAEFCVAGLLFEEFLEEDVYAEFFVKAEKKFLGAC